MDDYLDLRLTISRHERELALTLPGLFMIVPALSFFRDSSNEVESTYYWHLLAFCVSAFSFSGLVSRIAFHRITYPRLLEKNLQASLYRSCGPPGKQLGGYQVSLATVSKTANMNAIKESITRPTSFGYLYALLTLSALTDPDYVASSGIPATTEGALKTLLIIDIICLLRGKSLKSFQVDHWAHLSGAAFGCFYYNNGPAIWEFAYSLLPVPSYDY
ncbi:hypothetical protein AX16_006556 [Volvariella volvacea WC 439]|nr:hypothetical protein AX16_006556 [Volvariella volvacea WC 439]